MNKGTHACPGCKRGDVRNDLFACTTCWRMLPQELKIGISTTYRNRVVDKWSHVRAMGAAILWYREHGPIKGSLMQAAKAQGLD